MGSRPVAISVAMLALVVTAVVPAVVASPSWATTSAWARPVDGAVSRPFRLRSDPYAAGAHRGVDLRARRSAPVGSACRGRVVFAGPVPGRATAVTVSCAGWRVSHLPLADVRVRTGMPVAAGAPLGRLAAGSGHAGLHLGIRRAGQRHGYVDPEPFLRAAGLPIELPPTIGRRGPRGGDHGGDPLRERRADRLAATPSADQALTAAGAPHAGAPATAALPLAPASAWLGLALLMLASCHGVRRRRRIGRDRPVGQELQVGVR